MYLMSRDLPLIEGLDDAQDRVLEWLASIAAGWNGEDELEVKVKLIQKSKVAPLPIACWTVADVGDNVAIIGVVEEIIEAAEKDAMSPGYSGRVRYAVTVKGVPKHQVFTLFVPRIDDSDDAHGEDPREILIDMRDGTEIEDEAKSRDRARVLGWLNDVTAKCSEIQYLRVDLLRLKLELLTKTSCVATAVRDWHVEEELDDVADEILNAAEEDVTTFNTSSRVGYGVRVGIGPKHPPIVLEMSSERPFVDSVAALRIDRPALRKKRPARMTDAS